MLHWTATAGTELQGRELSPEERDNVFSQAVIPSEKWRSGFSLRRPIWCEAELYKDVTNTDKGLE